MKRFYPEETKEAEPGTVEAHAVVTENDAATEQLGASYNVQYTVAPENKMDSTMAVTNTQAQNDTAITQTFDFKKYSCAITAHKKNAKINWNSLH